MSKISDSGIDDQQRALGRRLVTITLLLPYDLADQAEEVHAIEPEYLQRVVQYAIVRRSIYRGIRVRTAEHARENGLRVDGMAGFTPEERARFNAEGEALLGRVVPIEESEGRRILEEHELADLQDLAELTDLSFEQQDRLGALLKNRHHDGGAWADKERGR